MANKVTEFPKNRVADGGNNGEPSVDVVTVEAQDRPEFMELNRLQVSIQVLQQQLDVNRGAAERLKVKLAVKYRFDFERPLEIDANWRIIRK